MEGETGERICRRLITYTVVLSQASKVGRTENDASNLSLFVALRYRSLRKGCIGAMLVHRKLLHPCLSIPQKVDSLLLINKKAAGASMIRKLHLTSNDSTGVNHYRRLAILVTCLGVTTSVSLYTRRWRSSQLDKMNPLLSLPKDREDMLVHIERTGLMGRSRMKSVKAELQDIRRWHIDHGFKGGLVVRELTQPLFEPSSKRTTEAKLADSVRNPTNLARRECYYLYYEVTDVGEVKQQIFCRGTTLMVDVLTCLSFFMVYDEDLECRVHLGFRNQAQRILEDIRPLLARPEDHRATIEVSGHSLGAAAAYILAAKLRKCGYRVVRATSIASPRFCASQSAANQIQELLPDDNLRIHGELDLVPFLPQFGYHTGHQLYLANRSSQKCMFYIPYDEKSGSWSDSVFFNFRVWEILSTMGKPHGIPSYVSYVKEALDCA